MSIFEAGCILLFKFLTLFAYMACLEPLEYDGFLFIGTQKYPIFLSLEQRNYILFPENLFIE